MSILFAIGFAALLGGGYWLYHSLQHREPAAPAATAAPAAPAAASPAVQASPILRNLEVTGLRLVEDAKQKAFLQFVVVNHSAADLGDVSAKANLRSAASAPIATFTFKTTLGPYEAKDLKVPVQTKLRVYELPDWQFLRAELVP